MKPSEFTSSSAAPSPGAIDPSAPQQVGRSVTWRSLAVGTLSVLLIATAGPYNDMVLSDTPLTATFLPVAGVLALFLIAVVINAPLHRFAPRMALRTGELAVIMLMTLVACAVPAWGLVRFLVPTPVAPFRIGQGEPEFWTPFIQMGLPSWLFPVQNMADGRTERVVSTFYQSVSPGEAIPWGAWVLPAISWGVFAVAMVLTLLAMARLVTYQWLVNERLPFPLVQIQVEIIEAPERGRWLNSLLASRTLWIGLCVVFVIHSLTVLSGYFPSRVPTIPLGYDLSGVFSEEPLVYLNSKVKAATISFMVLGVTFFIRSRVALSLWLIYLGTNVVNVQQAMMGQQAISSDAWRDQHLGASVAFILGFLWIGRAHWLKVVRNAFGGGASREYAVAFWVAVAGIVTMTGWLLVMGVAFWMAALIVLIILAAHLVVTRVVAETGLPMWRSGLQVSQLYSNMPTAWLSGRDVYFAGVFTLMGPVSTRDSLATLGSTGLGITEKAGVAPRERWKVGASATWALLLALAVSATVTLWCHYTHPTPTSRDIRPGGNNIGAIYFQERDVADPFVAHSEGQAVRKAHKPAVHMGIGFGLTCFLQAMTLRFAWWPILPVGMVATYGAFLANAWFSVFIGWLCKVLVVRFGGVELFQQVRPLFVGMIFGEALAAGFWLVVNAVIVMNGGESHVINFII